MRIYEIEWDSERAMWVVWRGRPERVGAESADKNEAIELALEFARQYRPAKVRIRDQKGRVERVKHV